MLLAFQISALLGKTQDELQIDNQTQKASTSKGEHCILQHVLNSFQHTRQQFNLSNSPQTLAATFGLLRKMQQAG